MKPQVDRLMAPDAAPAAHGGPDMPGAWPGNPGISGGPSLPKRPAAGTAGQTNDAVRDLANDPLAVLPDEVRGRLQVIRARAAAKLADVRENPAAPRLLDAARNARNAKSRVIWLQRWGSAWAQPLADVAACRRGCAHCCHLPVAITSAEAQLIGEAVGRQPAKLKAQPLKDLAADPYFDERYRSAERQVLGSACPFLQRGECTVYEQRPFACRTHLSLDDDDLLCRLIEGVEVPVPYVNATTVYGLFLAAQPNEQLADIRVFFPAAP